MSSKHNPEGVLQRIACWWRRLCGRMDFVTLVEGSFFPFAARHGLNIQRLRSDVFQIIGKNFAIRIREGKGHTPDFLVTVLPLNSISANLDDLSHEFGLGIIAEFNGTSLVAPKGFGWNKWGRAFSEAVSCTETFLLPYLMGEKTSLKDVEAFIESKIVRSGVRWKRYNLSDNIVEGWKNEKIHPPRQL